MFKHLTDKICQAIDTFLVKAISRKFIVWLIATHMTYLGILESHNWLTVAIIYIGSEAVLDFKNLNFKPEPVPNAVTDATPIL